MLFTTPCNILLHALLIPCFFLSSVPSNLFSYYGRSRIPKNLSESLPTGLLQNGADLVLMISLIEKGSRLHPFVPFLSQPKVSESVVFESSQDLKLQRRKNTTGQTNAHALVVNKDQASCVVHECYRGDQRTNV
ncbi:hypothetical protein M413DRAFT_316890 [Hebeloma cylindrosporum]|uniref:Uncharacterized protein n=1 Tax=Hebeloma cylindrosporum TaxID=76867 RepID=A0A0C2Y9K3_HEBCY|nr:hypothetical protein M413DRAFT_316890 [Hebeloma cylindrosporum h7]